MAIVSQEHRVLITSCHYVPHAPNLSFQLLPPPLHQRQLQVTIFGLPPFSKHTTGFPNLSFYLLLSPYLKACLTSHLIGILFILQSSSQLKGHPFRRPSQPP